MKEQDNRRYPIGPFEYGQTYSFDDTRKHIRVLEKFPKELKKTIKKLRGSDLDKPYRTDGWTARQVIHHIADSHMNAYIRMKLAVTENTPIIKPYEENLWAETEDGLHGAVKMSIKIIAALHTRWVEFLESLSEEDLERGYYNPASKRTVQMQEAIALYVWHSQHHLHHIRLINDGKTKSESAPAPDIDVRTAAGAALPAPKRRGPKPKESVPAIAADTTPQKRTMSEEHKAKLRAAYQARTGKVSGPATAKPIAAGKRVRRTKEQIALDNAAAKTAEAPVKRKAGRPAQPKTAAAPATSKRVRRTKEQIALDNAAAKSTETPVKRTAGRPAQPKAAVPVNAPATPGKRIRWHEGPNGCRPRQLPKPLRWSNVNRVARPGPKSENTAAPSPEQIALDECGSSHGEKPMRTARTPQTRPPPGPTVGTPEPKPASATDGTPKKRGMSAEHMAKIREARMAKRAAAGNFSSRARLLGSKHPKPPKTAAVSSDGTHRRSAG